MRIEPLAGPRHSSLKKWFFERMPVGSVMTVPVDEQVCTLKSFREMVSRNARKHRLFLRIEITEDGEWKVYRLR